ncbi:kinase-like domain-containing protein [Mycotypha africana]|uniref:kinase-like domain-containing protein n=1 Tax=Mycotypha africana TaxID=64632 RepID=UPI002300D448|nr:kinase-like domain-containing protein [Mycotypha africana]KAI8973665.1 kinase-like domain-containing protein [Mycotypha africana]
MTTTTTRTSSSSAYHQDAYWSQLATSMVDKIIGSDQQYQLLEVLGHGAYGCLFLGQSLQDHAYVAIKVLSTSGLDDQQRSLQQLEIDIQTSLNKHPHILALYHTIETKKDDYLYMVMELCDGGDLFDFVLQQLDHYHPNDESLVKKLFLQIVNGVEYMHQQGVYHRDLKLENILLKLPEQDEGVFSFHDEEEEEHENDDDDNNDKDIVCKVADFGLATRERYSWEYGCGSPSYLAPEHFIHASTTTTTTTTTTAATATATATAAVLKPYDAAASDIWSLGILLLALMFGRNPWQEASLDDPAFSEFKKSTHVLKQQLFPDISMSLYHFLTACLAVDPQQRPSITELKEKFQSIDHLYATTTTTEEEEEEEGYVSIPHATSKKNTGHSFDSAFFSGGGMSWSDMMDEEDEEEEEEEEDQDFMAPTTPPSTTVATTTSTTTLKTKKEALDSAVEFENPHPPYEEDEDDTMFVHRGEQESWWL